MKQAELAQQLGVSKAYISMVMSGKRKASKRVAEKLKEVNLVVNSVSAAGILNHARLPIPTLPQMQNQSIFYHTA